MQPPNVGAAMPWPRTARPAFLIRRHPNAAGQTYYGNQLIAVG
jgi:hypothetical protein